MLRAIFERACDPARPERYKKDTTASVPQCLHRMLRGKRPTLPEFIDTDDTVIVAALKRWSRSSADPVLKYLATCLIERRLFKEVRFENMDDDSVRDTVREKTRSAVAAALARQISSALPVINQKKDGQALDYFVLVDECTFKTHGSFDGIMFDPGGASPKTFEDLQSNREYAIAARQPIKRTRMFVPREVLGSVKSALRELESK